MAAWKHSLCGEHFKKLSTLTNGRTGDDIRKIVEKASDWPYQKVQKAQHFRKRTTLLYCLDTNCSRWHVCTENASEAKTFTWKELLEQEEKICIPAITFHDLLRELKNLPPSVSPALLKTYVDYGNQIDMPIHEPYAFQ